MVIGAMMDRKDTKSSKGTKKKLYEMMI